MTRKANRPKKHKEREAPINPSQLKKELGEKQSVNLFGCMTCELLIFEYPDIESTRCPWCRQILDVHALYSYVAFAPGVQFSRTFGDPSRAALVE